VQGAINVKEHRLVFNFKLRNIGESKQVISQATLEVSLLKDGDRFRSWCSWHYQKIL